MAIFKNKNNKCWYGCCWEYKLTQPLWKTVWKLLKKLKIELPYDPVIPLLSKYPKESKSGYKTDTYTLMFIAALFTIAKYGNNPDAPQLIHLEFYPAIRKNDTI
jgi:hypothetical protein